MIPVFGLSIPFIFVLLILLLTKAPKLGVWVVGGLIVALVFGLLIALPIAVHDGIVPSPGGAEAPLLGLTVPFLFVLLVILLNKAPKMGAGVIVGVVVMGVFGAVLWLGASRPRAVHTQSIVGPGGRIRIEQDTLPYGGRGGRQIPAPAAPTPVVTPEPAVASPIWSEGVENEYEADVYPSRLTAVRALARRMCRPLARVIAEMNTATEIVLFQDENDGALAGPFKAVLAETLPDTPCSVLFGSRNLDANEIGVTLRSHYVQDQSQTQSELSATARHRDWEATVRQSFVDKPWMEDFSSFASSRPLEQFVVARSWETCTGPVEARNQALQDAATQLQQRIGKKWIIPGVEEALTVGPREVEEGGFIADLFLQSFDGVSGKFWRHALLINASPEKLKWLDTHMSRMAHSARMSWARMILSALGVLVVIIASYLFLNMATKGYYVWSLRIAGTVLAIAGIVSIILVLR